MYLWAPVDLKHEDMQKGLQIGLLAVVAVLLGVVAYGLMDKGADTPDVGVVTRDDAPATGYDGSTVPEAADTLWVVWRGAFEEKTIMLY